MTTRIQRSIRGQKKRILPSLMRYICTTLQDKDFLVYRNVTSVILYSKKPIWNNKRLQVQEIEMEPLVQQHSNVPEGEMEGNLDEPHVMFIDELPGGGGDGDDGGNRGSNDGSWRQRLFLLQRAALIVAPLSAFVALITVGVWVSQLGGLSTQQGQSKLVFNWHPLMMIIAFLFMTVASLSFRYSQELSTGRTRSQIYRTMAKLGHGLCWIIAALCMVLGLVAVFHSHNDPVSGFLANLYSFHSWVGILVLILYFFQLVAGMGIFGLPIFLSSTFLSSSHHQQIKYHFLQIHTFLGPLLYQGVLVTIVLGIQEKEGFVGCSYKVETMDRYPWQHFHDIPAVCRTSHTLGLLVLGTGLVTSFAMHSFEPRDRRQH